MWAPPGSKLGAWKRHSRAPRLRPIARVELESVARLVLIRSERVQMRSLPRRGTSAVRPILDRRIIDEFAPFVRRLAEDPRSTPEKVQTLLDRLQAIHEERRALSEALEDELP